MEETIKELRSIAATLAKIIDRLTLPEKDPTGTEAALPTLEQVRAVLAEKSRSGHTAEVRTLLQKYGANKLSEISEKDYVALLQDAEAINDGE